MNNSSNKLSFRNSKISIRSSICRKRPYISILDVICFFSEVHVQTIFKPFLFVRCCQQKGINLCIFWFVLVFLVCLFGANKSASIIVHLAFLSCSVFFSQRGQSLMNFYFYFNCPESNFLHKK